MLVSRQAIENNVSQVVGYINLHQGPQVLKTDRAGYGLFDVIRSVLEKVN